MPGDVSKTEFPPLLPGGFWPMSLTEMRAKCVGAFPFSRSRHLIFDGIEHLITRLSTADIAGELWIDGSFVTEKLDPGDADILVRVSSQIYDNDPKKRLVVGWATDPNRLSDHRCDSYRWIEYRRGHPAFALSEDDRKYWSDWFGHSRAGVSKGIVVIEFPLVHHE